MGDKTEDNEGKKKLEEKKIYIDHDLIKEEMEIQKLLREREYEEKKKGNKVKVSYKKIWINGKNFVWIDERNKIEKNEERDTWKRGG